MILFGIRVIWCLILLVRGCVMFMKCLFGVLNIKIVKLFLIIK